MAINEIAGENIDVAIANCNDLLLAATVFAYGTAIMRKKTPPIIGGVNSWRSVDRSMDY